MIIRRVAVVGIVLAGMLALGGCDGSPAPAASTPPFASEEEAFAAAEETYRAYVDALNAERSKVQPARGSRDYLTGAALKEDLGTDDILAERGWTIIGESHITGFTGEKSTSNSVGALVCVDASATRVLDATGQDVTPPDREVRTSLVVEFVPSESGLLIAHSAIAEESICE